MTPATEQILHIDGHRLMVLALNPDTPGRSIILLHGITASVRFWAADELASLLTPYGPCYSLSLPGHYPAAFPPDMPAQDLTAEMMAHVLTAAIRQLAGEQPALLVGHSTGGFAALDIAAHTPDLTCGVISIGGFARGRWTGLLGLYQRLARDSWFGRARLKAQ
ncbi:MAG: alpha/beta hydrolase, partial [Chloroflexi bacterium]|nr:alpha/beta hydrolase [Chloroflexota bacterium]